MSTLLADQVNELIMRRERIKLELSEKLAERQTMLERYIVYGERTPAAVRVTLNAKIACLEADRQRTKVELLELKLRAKEVRETKLIHGLFRILRAHGLHEEIALADKEAIDVLKHHGLLEAYRQQSREPFQ